MARLGVGSYTNGLWYRHSKYANISLSVIEMQPHRGIGEMGVRMTEIITRSELDLGTATGAAGRSPRLDLVDFSETVSTLGLDPTGGEPSPATTKTTPRALEQAGAPAPAPQAARRFPDWCRRYVAAVALLDLLAAVVGVVVAIALPTVFGALNAVPVAALLLAPAWPMVIAMSHGYDRSRVGVGSDEMRAVFAALVATVAVGGFAAALLPENWIRTLILVLPVIALLSLTVRFAARKVLHGRQSAGADVRTVLLVGSATAVVSLAAKIRGESHNGMRVVAACIPSSDNADIVRAAGIALAGDIDHVSGSVTEFGADAVAVASGTEDGYLRKLAWSLEGSPVELLVDPGLVEVAGPRLHIRPFVGLPLLHVEQPTFSGWKRVFKAAADVTIAGAALIMLSPVWLAVAVAIKLEDRGPVFFRQDRVGKDGRIFAMWKFRSMVIDAEAKLADLTAKNEGAGPLFKMKRDPRITKVGAILRKYSIDELPQLFNILNRSMSLVGPRPPLQREVELYEKSAHRRLLVQPGLTGLWQVSGRSNLTWEESIRLDLRYVENWSFTGDLLIMWKTLFAVLGRSGAY